MVKDFLKTFRIILSEVFFFFEKNKNFTAASSLAFSATLALIPALFLLTFLFSIIIGSSGPVFEKTQEMLQHLIPAYSQNIIQEVQFVSSYIGTIGIVNSLILLWSVTPLVADMRVVLGAIFRKQPNRPFLLEKLFDVAISIVFLLGISAIAVAGVIFTLVEKQGGVHIPLGYLGGVVPFLFVTVIIFSLYFIFSKRVPLSHLAIGALITSLLWFAMRPAFQIFLTYNPGYGFAFGSFKSLFVIVVWIYCSLVVFLLGAEIAANVGRDDTVFLKKLIEGKTHVPSSIIGKYVVSYKKGSTIFNEGDPGNEMFRVHKGRVAIFKGDKKIETINAGEYFGSVSFLSLSPRDTKAVALEDVDLVTISSENINKLMNDYPEFFIQMLRETALRLRETSKKVV